MITLSEAERELSRLLKRALKNVPFVRLDKVEEVTEKFKIACTLLEEHLGDDVDLSAEEDDGADETTTNIPRSVAVDDHKASSDSDEENDDDDDEERREAERQEKEQKEKEDKDREARIRPKAEAVQKDFSSPNLRSRGLKAGGPAEPEPRKIGASSRAVQSSRARGNETETGPRIGLKGASSRSKDPSIDLRKQIVRKKPPQDVAVSKDRFTKDEGTPRLGARSLLKAGAEGARQPADLVRGERDNTAVLARDAATDSTSLGDGGLLVSTKKPSSRAASGLSSLPTGLETAKTDKETDFFREDSDNNEDLPNKTIKSLPSDIIKPSNPLVDRIAEQSLETPHSPLQLNAHRTLLKIAQKVASDGTEVTTIQPKVDTPKPAFLRRLDSPKTNHGILIGHKTRLNKMLRRAKRALPHMKLEQYEQIKAAFVQAVELLETSTTTALLKKDTLIAAQPLPFSS